MSRRDRSAALTPLRRGRRGGAMTYAGSAQRIFMMRRRAEGRAELVVYTAAAVVLVTLTWMLLTLRVLVTWVLTELLETRRERHGREQRRLDPRGERRLGRDGQDRPPRQLLERTASAGQELLPALEAVSAAWHRGKHAAGQQMSEAGRGNELVGDADRERVIEELQHHMVAGRLTIEELEYRVGIAHGARTKGDLDRARDHLPPTKPG